VKPGTQGGRRDKAREVELYDTTLRDGAQRAGLSFSIEDRLRILRKLDSLGFPFVEGGWPGANPRETEFFKLAAEERLEHATLTAFGMTRKAGESADRSPVLRDLLDAGTEVICLVGKSWDLHVTEALRAELAEGLTMVRDSVAFLVREGRRVFFDAEHFFDGYRDAPEFAMAVLAAAEEGGAERLVLCDTNGGTLPTAVASTIEEVKARTSVPLGVHFHNDAGCAVANSVVAVEAGAFQVQGTVNGYGERIGNADMIPVAANLSLKTGARVLAPESVARLAELAHYVAEIANVPPDSHQPYAGRYAFTHKAGLHASGVSRFTKAYEHVAPEAVGNTRGVVASELGGRSTVQMKAEELGLELRDDVLPAVLQDLKEREARGYTFEVADASLELLIRRHHGWVQRFFEIESYRVHVEQRGGDEALAEATVKVIANGSRHIESAEGQGPVGALDNALRKALSNEYPELEHITLEDYRVRVLDENIGTGATVRVLIDTSNGQRQWTSVGVSYNIIEASWEALTDGYLFGLLHPRDPSSGS
jgi:2-isopropylmalate synthase